MKQISTQELINIIQNTKKLPVTITNCIITGGLESTDIKNVRFGKCHFLNVNFSNCVISSCLFSHCQMTHINFHSSKFQNCILKDSTLFNIFFLGSELSANKFSNISSTKFIIEKSQIKHSKLMYSSLIATAFKNSTILDCVFEFTVLDASKFESTEIINSNFNTSNMRGVLISECNISATIFDDINFDDALNQYPSEFYIPTKYTTIQNNTVNNITILNTVLRTTFEDFLPHNKSKNKVGKPILKSKKYTYVKNDGTKHFLPPSFKIQNTKLSVLFCLHFLITAFFVYLFYAFYTLIQEIEYKQLETFVEFPLRYFETTVEMHDFVFYGSFSYFLISAIILLICAILRKNNESAFYKSLYIMQITFSSLFLFWVYWNNMQLRSVVISVLNLLFAFYFIFMLSSSNENNS